MASLTAVRHAEYLLLEVALPGRPVANFGLLLYDPAGDRMWIRVRKDLDAVAGPEDAEVLGELRADLEAKAREMGAGRLLAHLEDGLSNVLRISGRRPVEARNFEWKLAELFDEHVRGVVRERAKVVPFVTHLPVHSLRAAAGGFGEDMEVEPEDWVEAPAGLRITRDMFAAHVTGHSMEPLIPDGSLCVFRGNVTGTRQGKLLLIERLGASEAGGQFTVKRYKSRKVVFGEGEWRHEAIRLEPLNPDYDAWELEEGREFHVRGEFLRVLHPDEW